MALISADLAARIAGRCGVVTAHELIADGFSLRALEQSFPTSSSATIGRRSRVAARGDARIAPPALIS